MDTYIDPNSTWLTPEQKAWLCQKSPAKPELVSPLDVAEAADWQLTGLMGLRAMTEGIVVDMLPDDAVESIERLAPLDPTRRFIPVDEVAEQAASDAMTPRNVDEVIAGLRATSTRFFRLPQAEQVRLAKQVLRQARRAEAEERLSSLAAADAVLDEGWTAEKAAAARARRQQAQTKAWAGDELANLQAVPDGHRLAEVERHLSDSGLAGQFTTATKSVRAALTARAKEIADSLSAQAVQAADKAMLYEIANAALLAGNCIGADVSGLVQPALNQRETTLKTTAEQAAAAQAARGELAALKTAPHGDRLADVVCRLTVAGLAATCAADIAETRRAVREAAFGLALAARPAIRAAADVGALRQTEQAARKAGAEIGAGPMVMEYIAGDIARRQRDLDKEAARQQAIAESGRAETGRTARPGPKAPRPVQLDKAAESEALLAELVARNPRVDLGKGRRPRFHGLTRAEQEKFVAEVVSLQQQIMNTWVRNGKIVVRVRGQAGLHTIQACEFQPDNMRLVGLEWMARRIEKSTAAPVATGAQVAA